MPKKCNVNLRHFSAAIKKRVACTLIMLPISGLLSVNTKAVPAYKAYTDYREVLCYAEPATSFFLLRTTP